MRVITMESDVYKSINDLTKRLKRMVERIEKMEKSFEVTAEKANTPLGERWVDIQTVCMSLNISKRTLQDYRDRGMIPYSIIGQKVFFRASDVNKFLMKYYHKAKRI